MRSPHSHKENHSQCSDYNFKIKNDFFLNLSLNKRMSHLPAEDSRYNLKLPSQ